MLLPQVSGNARSTCPRLPADARHSRLQLHVVSAGEEVLVREGEGGRGRLLKASLAAGGDIVVVDFLALSLEAETYLQLVGTGTLTTLRCPSGQETGTESSCWPIAWQQLHLLSS